MDGMDDVGGTARTAKRSAPVRYGARLGHLAIGLLHLLIAWIALRVAYGRGGGDEADQAGALQQLRETAAGPFLLWSVAVGLGLLAAWHLIEAFATRDDLIERARAGGSAVLYGALGWTATQFALGEQSSSGGETEERTAWLLSAPAGRVLVAAVGLGIVAAAGSLVYRGWTRGFMEELREHPGPWIVRIAQAGHIAKGVALGVTGALFCVAAVQFEPSEAGGLDEGLRTLRDAPLGPAVLTVVAIGIGLFGVYAIARVRYGRI